MLNLKISKKRKNQIIKKESYITLQYIQIPNLTRTELHFYWRITNIITLLLLLIHIIMTRHILHLRQVILRRLQPGTTDIIINLTHT